MKSFRRKDVFSCSSHIRQDPVMTFNPPPRDDFPQPAIHSALTLDRMAEKRGDTAWVKRRLEDKNSRFLLFADLLLAVDSNADRSETRTRWYAAKDLVKLGVDLGGAMLLGCNAKGHGVFAVSLSAAEAVAVPGGMDALHPLVDLRTLALQGALTPHDLSLVAMGRALAAWHDETRCCGRCGGYTIPCDAGWRRQCWACGGKFFPRTDPAVIVLITDGTRCLLGHHKRYAHKFYSTLAGFVEPGEDIEACVRREMREETGLTIGEVSYLASQPWPFPHLLMIGCWAQALTSELRIEEAELHDARWFTREQVRTMMEGKHAAGLSVPGPHSIAYALIKSFVDSGG